MTADSTRKLRAPVLVFRGLLILMVAACALVYVNEYVAHSKIVGAALPAPPAAGSGQMLVRFESDRGEPLRRVKYQVSHIAAGGMSASGSTANDGWVLANVEVTGDVIVEVCGRRGLFGNERPTEHVRFVVPSPRPAEVRIRVGDARTVSGRVVDGSGRGVNQALVSAVLPGGKSALEDERREALTDSDGDFEIGWCGDMDYDLRVKPTFGLCEPMPIRVRGGASDVQIALRAALTPRVTVLYRDGRPLQGARVSLVATPPSPSDRMLTDGDAETTGRDGVVVPSGVDPATAYVLVVRPPTGRDDLFEQRIAPWDRADRTVTLERAYDATGVVVTQTGVPIPGALVVLRGAAGEPVDPIATGEIRTAGADGRFRVKGLRAGAAFDAVAVVPSDDWLPPFNAVDRGERSAGRIESGARDVRLVVDVGGFVVLRAANGDDTDRLHPFEHPRVSWAVAPVDGGLDRGLRSDRPFLVPSLDPVRKHTILVGPSRLGRCALLRGVVADGRTIDVRLEPCEPLEGRVDGARAAEGAMQPVVDASLDGVVLATAQVLADGSFRFPALPDVEWSLRVRIVVDPDHPGAAVTARPGATDVVLRR